MDQEGEQVAEGAQNLADVILRQDDGDLIKAEGLAREAIRIRDNLHTANNRGGGTHYLLLTRILQKQGKVGDETKELYERSLAISIRNEGPYGVITATGNIPISRFHYYRLAMTPCTISTKRTQLLLAKSYLEEGIRIATKIHDPTHPNRVSAASLFSDILNELSTV
jgi:hypothetical protein